MILILLLLYQYVSFLGSAVHNKQKYKTILRCDVNIIVLVKTFSHENHFTTNSIHQLQSPPAPLPRIHLLLAKSDNNNKIIIMALGKSNELLALGLFGLISVASSLPTACRFNLTQPEFVDNSVAQGEGWVQGDFTQVACQSKS